MTKGQPATGQALLDDRIARALDPKGHPLVIVDGAKALGTPLRRTFGADVAIQHCRIHKARNIIARRPARSPPLRPRGAPASPGNGRGRHGGTGAAARSIPHPGRPRGLDAILTLRLGLPPELRRSLASTNSIESMHSVGRRPCRTVKRWRDAHMARRWPATGMPDARKGFRRVKACQQLPLLGEALIKQRQGRNPDTLQDTAASP